MKSLALLATLICFFTAVSAQKTLISYEDIDYLLHNNITKADTFLAAKGFTSVKRDIAKKTRQLTLTIPGGGYVNLNLRTDGKRLFIELETNEPNQYNLLYNSIASYVEKATTNADVQTFRVKDLCTIYIMYTDAVPYNPLRRVYDINIVSDKGVTAYN